MFGGGWDNVVPSLPPPKITLKKSRTACLKVGEIAIKMKKMITTIRAYAKGGIKIPFFPLIYHSQIYEKGEGIFNAFPFFNSRNQLPPSISSET